MSRYVFDVEADGFLDTATRIHCLAIYDIDTGMVLVANDQDDTFLPITSGLDILRNADLIIGHNAIKFDIPLLDKLYGFKPQGIVRDTLVLSRLIYSDIDGWDSKLHAQGKLPGKLFGSHSLEAWGYRLDFRKVGTDIEDWSVWTQQMQDRCEIDTVLTGKLWNLLESKKYPERCVELEHQVATLCAQMERNGFPFDTVKAIELYSELSKRRQVIELSLVGLFPSWWISNGEFTPKKDNVKAEYTKGAPLTKV